MTAPTLTVKVANISNKATLSDLISFFSYCGTIDTISLERDGDQAQMAFVTFKQPYAVKTALLLNNTKIVGYEVHILALQNLVDSESLSSSGKGAKDGGSALVSGKTASEMSEKFKIVETHMKTAKTVTEQAASQIGTVILNHRCFAKGALWVSGMLDSISRSTDRASKYTAELGNYSKNNSDCRKHK